MDVRDLDGFVNELGFGVGGVDLFPEDGAVGLDLLFSPGDERCKARCQLP